MPNLNKIILVRRLEYVSLALFAIWHFESQSLWTYRSLWSPKTWVALAKVKRAWPVCIIDLVQTAILSFHQKNFRVREREAYNQPANPIKFTWWWIWNTYGSACLSNPNKNQVWMRSYKFFFNRERHKRSTVKLWIYIRINVLSGNFFVFLVPHNCSYY